MLEKSWEPPCYRKMYGVPFQAGEKVRNKSIDRVIFTYYRPNQSFCENNVYRNVTRKVLSLFHGNLNVLLHVLYKIINKMYVKAEIAQNNQKICPVLNFISMFQNVLQ